MTKILINAGPSSRHDRLSALIDEIVLTGAYTRRDVELAVKAAFNKLQYETPPAGACRVPLTRGLWALVDDADFDRIVQFSWCAVRRRNGAWAATSHVSNRANQQMHRVICETSRLVDHINGDGLDNRRSNLRPANHSQNGANSAKRKGASGFKGVTFDKTPRRVRRWQAQIRVNYKRIHLGRFGTPEEAARAYDSAARKYFGAFARCNFAGEA